MSAEIIQGDCLVELPKMALSSVDLLVTDPPYGLSFMGKDWDKAVPSVSIWRECLRVLKPGAFAFIMSSPRLDVLSQMAVRLGEAGFNVGFTPIYWAYASGFPKATNIAKSIDRTRGVSRPEVGKRIDAFGDAELSESEDGRNLWGKASTKEVPLYSSEPQSPQAKALDGSYAGFQPKPAVEVIIVAMKPLSEKTYVEQALKNQKGVTWLDDARIPFQGQDEPEGTGSPFRTIKFTSEGDPTNHPYENTPEGRFPANLLVSDDVLNDGRNTISTQHAITRGSERNLAYGFGRQENVEVPGDSGSFSRYFSLDAWFADKIKELPESIRKTFPFLIEPKAGKEERNEGLDGEPREVFRAGHGNQEQDEVSKRFRTQMKNHHPTVKPLALMSYLITLGSRRGDLVLDPFAGSGTTCMAAKMLGRKAIGIEISEEYAKIAKARLTSISSLEAFLG